MLKQLQKEVTLMRILLVLLIITFGWNVIQVAWQILSNFSDIIIILIFAWLLSFILEPLVERINNWTRLPTVWSTLVTYLLITLLFIAIILLFIPAVTSQIQTFSRILPQYLDSTPPFFGKISENVVTTLNNSISFIPSVAQFFLSLFIVLIFSFYFIIDKKRINDELYYLVPKKWHEQLRFTQKVISDVFASFLRVQLIFGIISGIITWLILQILGIEFALSTGLLAGILTVIPLVGPLLAIIPPIFVAVLIDPAKALIIFIVLMIAQQLLFNVLGPKLLGNAFKVHPAIILISFFVGFKVAGGVGAIFAIPVLGIASIILKELGHHFIKPHRD